MGEQNVRTTQNGWARKIPCRKIPSRVQRRPEAENLHSPSTGAKSEIHSRRRAGRIARCVSKGPDTEPPTGASTETRNNIPLHFTRPKYCQTHLSQGRSYVSWKDS